MKLFNISLYKYIFLVFFVGLLVATAQTSLLNDFTQKGPSAVYAEGDDFGQPGFDGYPEPGFEGEEAPTPVDQPVIPAPEAPAQPAAPVQQPAAPAPSCNDDVRYCDANVGKNIHKTGGYWDGSQCVYAFVQEDACGQPVPVTETPAVNTPPVVNTPVVTPPVTKAQVCTPNEFNPNTCARCAGDGTWEGTPGSDFGPSNGSAAWCGCAAKYNQSAYNQYCQAAAPPAPVVVVAKPVQVADKPAAPVQQAATTVQQCNGRLEVVNGANICVTQTNTQQQQNDQRQTVTATANAHGGSAVITNPQPQVITRTEIIREQPIAIQVARVDCPSGAVRRVENQQIICEYPVKLAGVSVAKELPKTGLPIAAWAIGAFIPAGFKLRRFGKGLSQNYGGQPKFIWEDRQFKI